MFCRCQLKNIKKKDFVILKKKHPWWEKSNTFSPRTTTSSPNQKHRPRKPTWRDHSLIGPTSWLVSRNDEKGVPAQTTNIHTLFGSCARHACPAHLGSLFLPCRTASDHRRPFFKRKKTLLISGPCVVQDEIQRNGKELIFSCTPVYFDLVRRGEGEAGEPTLDFSPFFNVHLLSSSAVPFA